MIIKNEEKFLRQCLLSVQDLVDEIIVVDTGSTDKTKEIAAEFGAKIHDFIWCDDFSKARNESLKYATKDWILVLDADEVIVEWDHSRIKDLVNKSGVMGYVFTQRNYVSSMEDVAYGNEKGIKVIGNTQGGFVSSKGDKYLEARETAGWFPTPIVRLFRNTLDVCFKGLVHEDVSGSLSGEIKSVEVPIHHFGKMDVVSWKKKWTLYEKLAEKKAAEGDYYAYFELARQYTAGKKLSLAKEALEKSIAIDASFWASWSLLGTLHLLEGNLDEAVVCLERARILEPRALQIYKNLGVAYSKQGEHKKALDIFTIGLNLDANQADIFKNMGRCYLEIGDKVRADLAFKKALELNPGYGK